MLAVPLLVVLGVLLASADPVFASMVSVVPNVDPGTAFLHVAAVAAGLWGMAGLLRVASSSPARSEVEVPWRLGRIETGVLLGSMAGLFGIFAAAQLVALSGAGRHIIETAGLTYAEYARAGFFQLLWVAGLTLGILLVLRAVADLDEPVAKKLFVGLSEVVVALTLVIVVVAIHRMRLYEHAFGLTMLRLYVELFTFWVGVTFVMLGGWLAEIVGGHGRRRHWFPAVALGFALVGLFALNAVNPEALVVHHNVAFAERAGRFDPGYLADLSDDAVPALIASLPRLAPDARATILVGLCPAPDPVHGWPAYNLSIDRAIEARLAACSP